MNVPRKIFKVVQESLRGANGGRIESYALAHCISDVTEELKQDDPQDDRIVIAIIEFCRVNRIVQCKKHYPDHDDPEQCYFCGEEIERQPS